MYFIIDIAFTVQQFIIYLFFEVDWFINVHYCSARVVSDVATLEK